MVAAGAGTSLAAHIIVIVLWVIALRFSTGTAVFTIGQLVVAFGSLVGGILMAVKGDKGFGIGLLIGWGVGILILPVVGFGVCVYILGKS